MRLFTNTKLILEDKIINNGYLVEEDGIIKEFGEGSGRDRLGATASDVVDADGLYLSPGFVDIHTHGSGGHDYMDGTAEAFEQAAKAHMRFGATTILPTTLASTDEHLYRTLDIFKEVQKLTDGMPHLPGLHLEGPYFNAQEKGAMEERHLRLPEKSHYMPVLEYADGAVLRWSLAPELEGALEMADELVKNGIYPSAAHTSATYDQMSTAFDRGVTHLTHFYSAMSTITREGGFRILGVIESGYLIDGLTIEIIADGLHLPPPLLRLIFKCKNHDEICTTTDSMRGAGLGPGPTILGPLVGGTDVIIEDGIAKMPDRTSFAGSVATTDRLVRVLMEHVDLSLEKAVRATTLLPARFMGLEEHTGSIAVGKAADLIIFDQDIDVKRVFVSGIETTEQ
ncbi:MAG: N-acetylglucosamine-6-phosphate deacetylase [Sphaerochaeta sp.]|jgi:N-acetylglucosamine-6-phosphate deacetylase